METERTTHMTTPIANKADITAIEYFLMDGIPENWANRFHSEPK